MHQYASYFPAIIIYSGLTQSPRYFDKIANVEEHFKDGFPLSLHVPATFQREVTPLPLGGLSL